MRYSLKVAMNRFAPQKIDKVLKVHVHKKFKEPT